MPNYPRSTSNFSKALVVSAAGMHAQTMRVRVISENVANASSTAPAPGIEPYRRKTITFSNVFDQELGVEIVGIDKIDKDKSVLPRIHKPGDPGADKNGYVERTNVNALIEMMDLREASRSHDANLKVYQVTSAMLARTVDALKG